MLEARKRLPLAGGFDHPIFSEEGPEHYQAAYNYNKKFAKPGNYRTSLSAADEQKFRQWVKDKRAPFDPNEKVSDYDMRGFWKENPEAAAGWQRGHHFPDTYKTPYDTTFSRESKYATKDAPYWEGNKLIGKNGQLVFNVTE